MSYYKVDKHVKKFIMSELYNYYENKKKIAEIRSDIIDESPYNDGQPRGNEISDTTAKKTDKLLTTRAILIATEKINNIERALGKFSEQEQKDIDKIFFKGHSQVYAEMNDGISKDMYYHLRDKMIYLTAIEYNQL